MACVNRTAFFPPSTWRILSHPALWLAAVALVLFWGSLHGPWLLDDVLLIGHNPFVQRPARLPDLWLTDYWLVLGAPTGLYRPFPMTTYAVTWWVFGKQTLPYHLTNVALHASVAVLVWLVILGGRRSAGALLAAFLFVAHPVHTEAVANIVGRSELLLALGFLGGLWAHRFLLTGPGRPLRNTAALAALAACAWTCMLFSKETGLLLAGYVLVEDAGRRRLRTTPLPRLAVAYAVLGGVAALYGTLRTLAVTGGMIGPHVDGLRERVALTATAALKNLELLVWPTAQRAVWNYPDLAAVPDWQLVAGIGLIVFGGAVTVTAVLRGRPWMLAVALGAISSILLLHPVPNTAWVWERGLYTPSISLVWIVALAVDAARPAALRRLLVAVAVLAAAAAAVRTLGYDRVFADELRFWEHQVERNPADAPSLLSLSEVLARRGEGERALDLRFRAHAADPRRAPVVAATAGLLIETGRRDTARDFLTSASATRLSHHTRAQGLAMLRLLETLSRQSGATTAAASFSRQAAARAPRGQE